MLPTSRARADAPDDCYHPLIAKRSQTPSDDTSPAISPGGSFQLDWEDPLEDALRLLNPLSLHKDATWTDSAFGGVVQTTVSSLFLLAFFNSATFAPATRPTVVGLIANFTVCLLPTLISMVHILRVVTSTTLNVITVVGLCVSSVCMGYYLDTLVVAALYMDISVFLNVLFAAAVMGVAVNAFFVWVFLRRLMDIVDSQHVTVLGMQSSQDTLPLAF